jgi:nitroreductase/NAD-dependent dihydropyrimidine dehydrogenase PreA subunit
MPIIEFDSNKCTKCGQCVNICPQDVLEQPEKTSVPKVIAPSECISCGHCIAICPADANRHAHLKDSQFQPITEIPFDGKNFQQFLASKRSIRHFKDKPLEKEIIQQLLKATSMAPSDNNYQDLQHFVITNKDLISKLEIEVATYYKKLMRFLNPMVRKFLALFVKDMMNHLEQLVTDLESLYPKAINGKNPIFRGAPCVIVTSGPTYNTLSRDNCLAAQHYLMLQAQAMGLGSCIIGYASSAPSALKKQMKIPKGHQVYAVTIVGYPSTTFKKGIIREASPAEWL